MAETVAGSCLCGGVRFEVELPFTRAVYCHCSRCRKHSGTFGSIVGHVPRSQVHVLEGEELIRVYEPPGGRVKAFCSVCGSSLFGGEWPGGEMAAIRLGALDDEDRKSTRLNSSHVKISYAVFCLKKKKKKEA